MTARRLLRPLTAAALCVLPASASVLAQPAAQPAQSAEPSVLDALTKVVDWFTSVAEKFDRFATREEYNQFVRSVERLTSQLFRVESDMRNLQRLVTAPEYDRVLIDEAVASVRASLDGAATRLDGVASQLRTEEQARGDSIETLLRARLGSRARLLGEMELLLGRGAAAASSPGADTSLVRRQVRQKADSAVLLAHNAQLAAARFLGVIRAKAPR